MLKSGLRRPASRCRGSPAPGGARWRAPRPRPRWRRPRAPRRRPTRPASGGGRREISGGRRTRRSGARWAARAAGPRPRRRWHRRRSRPASNLDRDDAVAEAAAGEARVERLPRGVGEGPAGGQLLAERRDEGVDIERRGAGGVGDDRGLDPVGHPGGGDHQRPEHDDAAREQELSGQGQPREAGRQPGGGRRLSAGVRLIHRFPSRPPPVSEHERATQGKDAGASWRTREATAPAVRRRRWCGAGSRRSRRSRRARSRRPGRRSPRRRST